SADGFQPWLDEEDLLPGQKWEAEIRNAVREADVVLVCLSKQSAAKEGFIQKEIKFTLDRADEKPEGTVYVIPCLLEQCKIPQRLSHWQWVSLYEEQGYQKLARALRLQASRRSVAGGAQSPAVSPSPTARGGAKVNPKDGLTYVWIPPGRFTMGCSPGDNECFP